MSLSVETRSVSRGPLKPQKLCDRQFAARHQDRGYMGMYSKELAKIAFDPHDFLLRFGPGRLTVHVRKNQVVFSQGQTADCLYYLQSGRTKLTVTSERGKEVIVGLLEAKQFFGEGCLNGQRVRNFTVRAIESCEVTSITERALRAVLHDEPTFANYFIAYLLTRNSRIEGDLIDQLFNSSERRLARLLLLLANFAEDGSAQPISAKISQETLAEMIGTTRSRVSYFMNKFRKLGFVSYDGTITVNRSLLSVAQNHREKAAGFGADRTAIADPPQ